MARLALVGIALAAIAAPERAAGQTCPGDCDGSGSIGIEELVRGVNIALGREALSSCLALDSSGDGTVGIAELVQAVGAALRGCPATLTPTAALEATATITPVAESTATITPPIATPIPTITPGGPLPFCDLPGSLQRTIPGMAVVPGGAPGGPDLTFLDLPIGFCVHYFGNVGNTRQLRFSPSGDLFVASPTKYSTSNGPNGRAAIVVLPDDDHDGRADETSTFLAEKPDTVGLLFTNGFLYYQDGTRIMRVPHAPGERAPTAPSAEVVNITAYSSPIHWPKLLDVADDGTIYVGNGDDEGHPCLVSGNSFHGGILKIDGTPGGAVVARGFRNPISIRCVRGKGLCFAIELGRDFSTEFRGREKLVPIRQGDDWGFPCCATRNQPYDDLDPAPDCSGVSAEIDSFVIGDTPFDLDYELGRWPEPWGNRAYVPLHGAYGFWAGARLVGIELDAMTGTPLPGSSIPGMPGGAMKDFATGWADGTKSHGRPTVVAFAPDGRLFLGNDTTGDIIWIAPMGLAPSPE